MTTVLEALQNAQINFNTLGARGLKHHTIYQIAKSQLDNAITALENGMGLNDVLQEHIGAPIVLQAQPMTDPRDPAA